MAVQTRAKRRFGAHLAALRGRTDLSLAAAGKKLRLTAVTLGRYESGEVLPLWPTALSIMHLYGATAEDVAAAEGLWDAASDEPPPIRLPTGTTKDFRRLVNAEREAEAEWMLAMNALPGLLQTEAHARALLGAGHRFHFSEGRVESVLATRLSRQQRLVGPDALKLHALIDESVIVRQVGGPDVAIEQLTHLLEMGDRPNVVVQIIPFAVGAYGAMGGDCTIISYPNPDEGQGVYLDSVGGGAWVDDVNDVGRFTTMFQDVSAMALSPAKTSSLIRRHKGAAANQ
ncbi:MAG TPA: helix-turn-helix transcriptional regulator [Pseudonocardiaceae bacterium]|nr:helix-turn-helix transcriptional regulator [Pseudonocardiaceae bacterium]